MSRWNPEPPEVRFWRKVNKTDGCWLWTAAKDDNGYGRFREKGRSGPAKLAHVFAYETLIGPVPEGKELDHICRNPSCVNPAHVEPVTHKVNVQRGLSGKVNNPMTAKTHCPQGHPYDERNTYVNRQGKRECRTCHRERTRLRRGSIARRRSPYYDGILRRLNV